MTNTFRDFTRENAQVEALYKRNHKLQTYSTSLQKRNKHLPSPKKQFSILQVFQKLDEIIDESDPDTSNTQFQHALQSAQSARLNNEPRWLVFVCLVHDLGKFLYLNGEDQEFVVGDTFPVGCRFNESIIYHGYFNDNIDSFDPKFNSELGIYSLNCGLDNVVMSYGHDEYLYQVLKKYLSSEALFIIRYHSFYSMHTEGQYRYLMNDDDLVKLEWIKKFNKYDLYSKDMQVVDYKNYGISYAGI